MTEKSTAVGYKRDRILTRREVEGLIAEGNKIVIYEGRVLRVDSWLPRHPGGEIVVFHMVGRDATDEINAYHAEETKIQIRKYQIGKIRGIWKNFIPPIQGGDFRKLDEAEIDEAVILSDQSAGSSGESGTSEDEEELGNSSALSRSIKSTAVISVLRKADEGNITKDRHVATIVSPVAKELPANQNMMAEYERNLLEEDLEKYPSLDYETQLYISRRYRQLEQRCIREGLFQCTYLNYGKECVRYFLFGCLTYLFLRWHWYMVSAFWLGCLWHQLVFTVHDAGHLAITHNFFLDNFIGAFIADYIGGLSVGWWKRNHNVHHIVTNDPVHDPDIQHLPFFAVSTRLFGSVFSTYYQRILAYDAFAKVLIRVQNWTYYPILCFGRFNLYRLSWEYLLKGLGPRRGQAAWIRWFEIGGQIFFWWWFGYKLVYQTLPSNGVRFAYVMVSHIVTMPVHVQITLSHFAMSTADLGVTESFPQKMLRTTMDVDCPTWLDFFHGGLQFQAIHHLFPRMPRHNFRAAQKAVIEFCDDVGIQYCIYGFVDGNKEVIGRLADIAKQASIMADCTNHLAHEVAVTGKLDM
ncbi:fatty acid desaturase-domain-containing protein [Lipomyces oligophaga]|uniref:fatty acid desaturase-domain-containing protein n=1 Tax=Lipomyces oligophaga TaxID=45792 RepID=UPI0034CE15CB